MARSWRPRRRGRRRTGVALTATTIMIATALVGSGGVGAFGSPDNILDKPPVEVINGELVYNGYANQCDPARNGGVACQETKNKNRLRGFSWAGYKGGGVALPEAAVGRTIEVSALTSVKGARKVKQTLRKPVDLVPINTTTLPGGEGVLPNNKTITAPFPADAVLIKGTDRVVRVPAGTTDLPAFTRLKKDGSIILPGVVESAAVANAAVIQEALDNVPASAAAPAAVLLPKGEWFVAESLTIRRSGVVLRGVGQGRRNKGTTLISVNTDRDEGGALIVVAPPEPAGGYPDPLRDLGSRRGRNTFSKPEYALRTTITDDLVPTGTNKLKVASTDGFAVGDTIAVTRTANQALVDASYPTDESKDGINPMISSFSRSHERVITKINTESKRLTLDRPLLDPIQSSMGGGDVTRIQPIPRLSHVGVEHLRIQSEVDPFDMPNDPDTRKMKEVHTRSAVEMFYTEDSWVQGITCRTLARICVGTMRYVNYTTVQDAAAIAWASHVTGGRRYAFHGGDGVGGSGVLFQRIYIEGARHPVVTGARVSGPVVWLDVESRNDLGDSGGHLGNAKGLLFDNLQAKTLQAWNKAPKLQKQGITSSQAVYWNSSNASYGEDGVVNILGPAHNANFLVGGEVGVINSQGGAFIYQPSTPSSTMPRSLYLAELEDRKGAAAVAAVTTAAQRQGRIWDDLAKWKGAKAPPSTG
ncbi:MAG: hypothetical protein AAGD35_18515 [Actinomycetota bacterium]